MGEGGDVTPRRSRAMETPLFHFIFHSNPLDDRREEREEKRDELQSFG